MKLPFSRLRPLLLVLAVTAFAACDDDDDFVDTEISLVGTYELVSITFQGQPTLEPPAVTGTFTLTETTYDVQISINNPQNPQQIVDEGVYDIDGNTWTQESSISGRQSVGTFTFEEGILTVDATTEGQNVVTVWSLITT